MKETKEKANELYEQGLEAFRAGKNEKSIALTTQSLEIGKKLKDDKIVGQALMGLCRTALRDRDETYLDELSDELFDLAEQTKDDWWRVVIAHMNAEMARMKGEFEKAENLYDKSMEISEKIGSQNMVATECFNKSFVAIEQGKHSDALALIQKHFSIRKELDGEDINPYGLIAVANYFCYLNELEKAAEVAFACRRLLEEKNVVPDPADEEPLKMVEGVCNDQLSDNTRDNLQQKSKSVTCHQIIERLVF